MFAIEIGELAGPRWIVNLPTTQHGRQPPQLARVTVGRAELHRITCLPEFRSIAIPAVGAAIGYLD